MRQNVDIRRFLLSEKTGYLAAGVAAVGFSFKSIWIRQAYDYHTDSLTLLLMRLFAAAPLYLAAVYHDSRRSPARPDHREWIGYALLGIVGLGGSMYFSFEAIRLLGASLGTIIVFVYPLLIILVNSIRERSLPFRQMLVGLLAFAGLILALGIGELLKPSGNFTGIIYGLAAAVCFTFYSLVSERLPRRISSIRAASYTVLFMTLFYALLFGFRDYPHQSQVWVFAIMLGTVSGFIPFILQFHSLRLIGAGPVAIISCTGPVLTMLWAGMFLDERLELLQYVGAAGVLGAVLLQKKRKSESRIVEREIQWTK